MNEPADMRARCPYQNIEDFTCYAQERCKLTCIHNQKKPQTSEVRSDELLSAVLERVEEIKKKRLLAQDKRDYAPGGGEAFWDGRLREAEAIANMINDKIKGR